MTAAVSHMRPSVDTTGLLAGRAVSATDWAGLGALANWVNGHCGQLIPWACCPATLPQSTTATFRFYVAPSARAVERVWAIRMHGYIGTVTVTCGTGSAESVQTTNDPSHVYVIREPLASQSSTAGEITCVITTPAFGEFEPPLLVESIACFEQTRGELQLGSPDYGVELDSLRVRLPIYDNSRGVDNVWTTYQNLDGRRAGVFHWADPTDPITVTSGSAQDLFPLQIPFAGAIVGTGTTTTSVTCYVLAKVTAGSATITFSSSQAGASQNITVTQTAYTAWQSVTLTVQCEDLTVADGRRGSAWETIRIQANGSGSNTLDIQSISIIRATQPL